MVLILTNQSAGVALLQGKFKGEILTHKKDDLGRWVLLVENKEYTQFITVNCYASNNKGLTLRGHVPLSSGAGHGEADMAVMDSHFGAGQ